jgi:predicted HTH domain antitoxin
VEIPQDVLDSARLTPAALKVEIALSLYAQGRLAIGKARELSGMSLWEFRQLLSTRGVHSHFEIADLGDDVAALRQLGRP